MIGADKSTLFYWNCLNMSASIAIKYLSLECGGAYRTEVEDMQKSVRIINRVQRRASIRVRI